MPVEWYEHPDDEHTVHHVFYSHRAEGENWYGFSPPEPDVSGECAVCGCEIWNPENTIAGEYVCEECRALWDDRLTILDLFRTCVVLKEQWALEAVDQIREDFDADLFKVLKK